MDEYKRGTFADGEPPVAKLHQGDETRIEIKAHFCQAVLLASSDVCRDLPENLEPRQLSQAVRQRGARNLEGRAERFECSCAEKGLANDEKRPCVRNNVQHPRDRAVSFAPDETCNLCSLRRDGRGGGPAWRYFGCR